MTTEKFLLSDRNFTPSILSLCSHRILGLYTVMYTPVAEASELGSDVDFPFVLSFHSCFSARQRHKEGSY